MNALPGLPHESWAFLYDAVYERGYGRLYEWMTKTTLAAIAGSVPPPATVVDFGAGTGRLALPLAQMGYSVTAVEPARAMLDRLEDKARAGHLHIKPFHGRMEDFHAEPVYDLAVCVFTVLVYMLDEDQLRRSFRAAAGCLKPGGRFLVDVSRREMFSGGVVRGEGVRREIEISPLGGEQYAYVENTSVEAGGEPERFREEFTIRYWPPEEVRAILAEAGFELEKDLTPQLKRSGCDYYLMKKALGSSPLSPGLNSVSTVSKRGEAG